MKTSMKKLFILMLIAGFFASCTDSKDDNDNAGDVSVKLTDAAFPFGFVSKANVGITKIEFKNANGEYITVFESGNSAGNSYNILDYTNGKTVIVKNHILPVGVYSHSRVTFGEASVIMNGSITGSGENSFFNFNNSYPKIIEVACDPVLDIEDAGNSDVLIDIDADKSFQFQSSGVFGNWINLITNIEGCTYNPTFRVCDLNKTGKISGNVTYKGVNTQNAIVTVTVSNNVLASHTEANGTYAFIGVPAGSYNVKVELEDGTTSTQSVTVGGTNTANCDFVLN
jgi:hypothetical protein